MPQSPAASNATPPHAPAVLLLAEGDAAGNLDKRALRETGTGRVESMTSGVAAARLLAGLKPDASGFFPDVVVCTQRLADMSGEQFCAILRLHPLLLDMPVLLILPHDNEVEQLRTLGCGASALLARPYSVQTLKEHLNSLAAARPSLFELERAARLADTSAFDEALATYGMLLKPVRAPEDYFRVGMQCLEQGKWNSALNAFQRALRGALIRGKAELGMAAAWKGKGDMQRYRLYLARAAATFVRACQWSRARAVYGRLLQEDPTARSPFLAEALQRMRQGAYEEAAAVLAQGYSVTPRQQLREKLAQACLTAAEPQAALQDMEHMLEMALGEDAGEALGEEIRRTLDNLARQLEMRRQEEAAERRHLARQATRRSEAAAQAQAPTHRTAEQPPNPAQGNTADRQDSPSRAYAARGTADSPADGHGGGPVIAPLGADTPAPPLSVRPGDGGRLHIPGRDAGEPENAGHSGGLGDILSVMKFTWRLARRK